MPSLEMKAIILLSHCLRTFCLVNRVATGTDAALPLFLSYDTYFAILSKEARLYPRGLGSYSSLRGIPSRLTTPQF